MITVQSFHQTTLTRVAQWTETRLFPGATQVSRHWKL